MSRGTPGECPYCGSENIKYGSGEIKDGECYDYFCECENCHKVFIEGYHLEFDGMFDVNGMDIEVKKKEENKDGTVL